MDFRDVLEIFNFNEDLLPAIEGTPLMDFVRFARFNKDPLSSEQVFVISYKLMVSLSVAIKEELDRDDPCSEKLRVLHLELLFARYVFDLVSHLPKENRGDS